MKAPAPLRSDCFAAAAKVLGEAFLRILTSSPEEAAREVYRVGGPALKDLEREIADLQRKYLVAAPDESPVREHRAKTNS